MFSFQERVIWPLFTAIVAADSGEGAGPPATDPSAMWNLLPWHGQLMVPPETLLTVQPACVQTAVNALNVPVLGWVTTTLWSANTLPPPSGMSDVAARTVPPPEPPAALLEAPPAGALLVSPPAALLLGSAAGVLAAPAALLLLPLEPQAARTPAAPTTPTPASTVRRAVVCWDSSAMVTPVQS
jgi:hypothetical protein